MHVTFHGAAQEVTGSMHMISTDTDAVLLDCGLFQGRRKESAEKNRVLPVDPSTVTNVVLSHAHIDHSGRLPLLVRNGFNGRIITTRASHDLCRHLLTDSAHIQESDADYLNYKAARSLLLGKSGTGLSEELTNRELARIKKQLKSGNHRLNREAIHAIADQYLLEKVEPLYTMEDAERSLGHFDGFPYKTPVTIGRRMTCTFYEAGHILGSAISIIRTATASGTRTIGYTGDLGRFDMPILKNPTLTFQDGDTELDLLIMESTYGDRSHEPQDDLYSRMTSAIIETVERGGSLVIPSFALGRAQTLLYVIHELYNRKAVPELPVYVDSPLASNLTSVFGQHPELYDQMTHTAFLEHGKNPFYFNKVKFVSSVEDSMALMRDKQSNIVISASGMCEVGRILHHLRHKIHNPDNTILIVGFMAQNTLGRRIVDLAAAYEAGGRKGDPPTVRILGKEYPLKARVIKLGGFSAHADTNEMMRFMKESNLSTKRIAVVHGEKEASLAFCQRLNDQGFTAFVPEPGSTVQIP